MVKIEALDLELAEIECRRFNFPWCTRYSPKRYKKVIDFLIHKYPNDFRPHSLRPILLFEVEVNMKNKALGRYSINHAGELEGIATEQYVSQNPKLLIYKPLILVCYSI